MKPFKSIAERSNLEGRIFNEANQMYSEIQKFAASVDAMNAALVEPRLDTAQKTMEVLKEIKTYYDYVKIPTVVIFNVLADYKGEAKIFFHT